METSDLPRVKPYTRRRRQRKLSGPRLRRLVPENWPRSMRCLLLLDIKLTKSSIETTDIIHYLHYYTSLFLVLLELDKK
jgi:hypothetical protein